MTETRRWLRSPRRLLAALGVTTVLSAAALSWLGWEVLRQDRVVEDQVEEERLSHQADRAARELERVLADAEETLAATLEGPAPVSTAERLSSEGLLLVFTRSTMEAVPPSKVLFYPSVPPRSEPPPGMFDRAEQLEFRQRDLARAGAAYRTLSRSADPAIRAAALMGLGGVLRQSRQYAAALDAYRDMASLADAPVAGLPAALIARDVTWRVPGRDVPGRCLSRNRPGTLPRPVEQPLEIDPGPVRALRRRGRNRRRHRHHGGPPSGGGRQRRRTTVAGLANATIGARASIHASR